MKFHSVCSEISAGWLELWRTIADAETWEAELKTSHFVPFNDRYVQTGFFGSKYRTGGIVIIGQNPRGHNSPDTHAGDDELMRLTKCFAETGTAVSYGALRDFQIKFMVGKTTSRAWKPYTRLIEPLGLSLDAIAYLNLIPLATSDDKVEPRLWRDVFIRSTAKQIEALAPNKIVFFGQKPYELFTNWTGAKSNVSFISNKRSLSNEHREREYERLRKFVS